MTKFDRDFKEWYHKRYVQDNELCTIYTEIDFNELPIEMQFGVYQLFADSVNIELRIRVNHLNGMYVGIINQGITEAKRTRKEVMCLLITDFKKQYNNQ